MKLVIIFAFLGIVLAYEPVFKDYHNEIGIYEAERIKQAENAMDFDGARIIGGSPSTLGDHIYMAGLVILLSTNRESVCGASLLSTGKLVTAAHCWRGRDSRASLFTVVLASLRLFSGGVRRHSARVVMHPNYDAQNLRNDVAIISISAVEYTSEIGPIALASGSATYNNYWPTAVGFGITSDAQAGVPRDTVLRQVNLRVISNAECRSVYGWENIIDSSLCTDGGRGTGTCGGDSGGPLVLRSGGSRILIGITSFGSSRGCQVGAPSVFARVSLFNSWIRSQL